MGALPSLRTSFKLKLQKFTHEFGRRKSSVFALWIGIEFAPKIRGNNCTSLQIVEQLLTTIQLWWYCWLLQVVESEKTAKWQYTRHCEELTDEIKKLRGEVLWQNNTCRIIMKYVWWFGQGFKAETHLICKDHCLRALSAYKSTLVDWVVVCGTPKGPL